MPYVQYGHTGAGYIGNGRYVINLLFYMDVTAAQTTSKVFGKLESRTKSMLKKVSSALKKTGFAVVDYQYPTGNKPAYYKEKDFDKSGVLQLWVRVFIDSRLTECERDIEKVVEKVGFDEVKNPASRMGRLKVDKQRVARELIRIAKELVGSEERTAFDAWSKLTQADIYKLWEKTNSASAVLKEMAKFLKGGKFDGIAKELVKSAKRIEALEGKLDKTASMRVAADEIVFDGNNVKEVKKFLAKHGYDLNIESNGKLTVGDDNQIIFKEDTLIVKGGKLLIKKPSYGGGRETVVAAELVRIAKGLVASRPSEVLVQKNKTRKVAPRMALHTITIYALYDIGASASDAKKDILNFAKSVLAGSDDESTHVEYSVVELDDGRIAAGATLYEQSLGARDAAKVLRAKTTKMAPFFKGIGNKVLDDGSVSL